MLEVLTFGDTMCDKTSNVNQFFAPGDALLGGKNVVYISCHTQSGQEMG